MDKLFFRRLFSRPQKPAGETTETRAGHGDAEAQFSLGVKFAQEGAAQDYAQAAQWYLKAADLGDAGAQYNIGMKHHRASLDGLPEAAPESRIQAYKWFRLAAAQGYRGSEAAWAFVSLAMTREDVADGGRRIAAFVPAQANQA